ncbi:MAG: biopolymer transporter ExbD [Pseudomonadota bacterium]
MARRPVQAEDEEDINITPLLDIVFIMLIFFIVTSTFVKEPGAEITRPVAETAVTTSPGILVAIDPNNTIWINKQEVEIEGVRVAVERLRAENPKGAAVVQADEGSEAQYLVDVMEQISAAGVESIYIAADED